MHPEGGTSTITIYIYYIFTRCMWVLSHTVMSDSLWPHRNCSPPGSSVHGIFWEEYWIGLLFPSLGHLSNPGIEPTLAGGFFTTMPPKKSPFFFFFFLPRHHIILSIGLILNKWLCFRWIPTKWEKTKKGAHIANVSTGHTISNPNRWKWQNCNKNKKIYTYIKKCMISFYVQYFQRDWIYR